MPPTALILSLSRSPRLGHLLCGLLLLAAVAAFHAEVLLSPGVTFPWDFVDYHLPLAAAYSDALAHGQLPFWDPFTYCGRPLLANPQAAVLYPPMALAALPGRPGLLPRLELLAAAHVLLAALFTYLSLHRLLSRRAPALLGALLLALGPLYATQMQHLGLVMASAWLPVLLWSALQPRPVRAAGFALAGAGTLLAGFPAMSLAVLAAGGALALALRPQRATLADLLLGHAGALLLFLPQLAETLQLAAHSVARFRTDWIGHGGGIPLAALSTLLRPNALGAFDLATYHGPGDITQSYLFCGWTGLAAALYGAWRAPRRLALLAGLFLLLMLGEHTPAGRLLFPLLPALLQRSLYWFAFLAPATLGLALLAAYGAAHLPRRVAWALPVLLAAELLTANARLPMNRARLDPLAAAALRGELSAALSPLLAGGRLDTLQDSVNMMSLAPVARLRAAGGYDPLALSGVMSLRQRLAHGERWGAWYPVTDPDSPLPDALGVTLLTSTGPVTTNRLEPAGESLGRRLYRNPHALPRLRAPGCAIVTVAEDARRLTLRTRCAAPARLETAEAAYPAWQAAIDGAPQPVLDHLGAFRALDLPAGEHTVEFLYSPRRLGLALLLAALGAAGWLLLWRRLPR